MTKYIVEEPSHELAKCMRGMKKFYLRSYKVLIFDIEKDLKNGIFKGEKTIDRDLPQNSIYRLKVSEEITIVYYVNNDFNSIKYIDLQPHNRLKELYMKGSTKIMTKHDVLKRLQKEGLIK